MMLDGPNYEDQHPEDSFRIVSDLSDPIKSNSFGGSPSSDKTRPLGQKRDRPPHKICEHSWQKDVFSQNVERRRGRPPLSVTESLLSAWSRQLRGQRRGRPPNNYPSLEKDQVSKFVKLCPDT